MDDPRRYLSLHTVGMLRSLISKWWQVEIGLVDSGGRVLENSWGPVPLAGCDFCRVVRSSNTGHRRCHKSVKEIHGRLRRSFRDSSPALHTCHLGLGMIACSLQVDGHVLGGVFACGFSTRELSRTRIGRHKAAVLELSDSQLELDGDRVPVLNREDVERLRDLLTYGAQEMATVEHLPSAPKKRTDFSSAWEPIAARSSAMRQLLPMLQDQANLSTPVVLQGEPGVGKQTLARAVHEAGPRRNAPFVVYEASPDALAAETRLLGQVRGGSLGRVGVLERAQGGTVYLSPGSWSSLPIQMHLLRLIRESNLVPLGADRPIEMDVRLIIGMERDFDSEAASGRLRRDLADHLAPHRLLVPPLRSRQEDVARLIELFVTQCGQDLAQAPDLPPDLQQMLLSYSWPGNASELREEIRLLVNLARQRRPLTPDAVSLRIRQAAGQGGGALGNALLGTHNLKQATTLLEKELIREGLRRTRGNRSLLARQLGISRSNLLAKIARYDIVDPIG